MRTDEAAAIFAELRPYLHGVAYRLTSSWADAEDVVADAWPRWSDAGRGSSLSSRSSISDESPPADVTLLRPDRHPPTPTACLIVAGSSNAASMAWATSAREIDPARGTFPPIALR